MEVLILEIWAYLFIYLFKDVGNNIKRWIPIEPNHEQREKTQMSLVYEHTQYENESQIFRRLNVSDHIANLCALNLKPDVHKKALWGPGNLLRNIIIAVLFNLFQNTEKG